jgi:hypothetical protein
VSIITNRNSIITSRISRKTKRKREAASKKYN